MIQTRLAMGLYDEPLPPRPPPRKKQDDANAMDTDNDNDRDDDDDTDATPAVTTKRLFTFNAKGQEVRNLLPPLQRRLTAGIACYYEETDRLAANLVSKTSCLPADACWALEACRGDLPEAWIRISAARRLILSGQRAADQLDDGDDGSWQAELEQEFQQRKLDRAAVNKKLRRDEFFRGGAKDDPWLPLKNPNPVDDEPWFTG